MWRWGEISQRVHIKSVNQKMLSDIHWENSPENKRDLIKLVCSYFKTDEDRNFLILHWLLRALTGKKYPQKNSALTKSMNMDIWVDGISNQLFIRGSYTETKFPRK